MRSRLLGLPLVACAIAGCATTAEDDERFEPPDHPLVFARADCPGTPRAVVPQGALAATKKLPTRAGGPVDGAIAVAHGGVGSPPELSDGPLAAARAALEKLNDGASALDAAIESTVILEDDPRFNAGTGSHIRLDGKTIQMDASLMTGDGAFAAIAAIERVKN